MMQFTYFAVLYCALWTLVSALPRDAFSSEIIPRRSNQWIERRSLYARAGSSGSPKKTSFKTAGHVAVAQTKNRPIPHQVSLKQSAPGTENEHWALHFHPKEGNKGDLHVLHAVSDDTKKGVLQPEHINKGTYNPKPGKTTHTIAEFPSQSKALAAMRDVKKNVKLSGQFPHENCVDFTCHAVQHMATNGRIPQEKADDFRKHYDANKDAVRAKTNTADNRKAAGA